MSFLIACSLVPYKIRILLSQDSPCPRLGLRAPQNMPTPARNMGTREQHVIKYCRIIIYSVPCLPAPSAPPGTFTPACSPPGCGSASLEFDSPTSEWLSRSPEIPISPWLSMLPSDRAIGKTATSSSNAAPNSHRAMPKMVSNKSCDVRHTATERTPPACRWPPAVWSIIPPALFSDRRMPLRPADAGLKGLGYEPGMHAICSAALQFNRVDRGHEARRICREE